MCCILIGHFKEDVFVYMCVVCLKVYVELRGQPQVSLLRNTIYLFW